MTHYAILPSTRLFKINLLFQLLGPGFLDHDPLDPSILTFNIMTDLAISLSCLLSFHNDIFVFLLDDIIQKISLFFKLIIYIVSIIITEVELEMTGLAIVELLQDLSVFDLLLHKLEESSRQVHNHDSKD